MTWSSAEGGRNQERKIPIKHRWTIVTTLFHYFVLDVCKCFSTQLKPGASMSCSLSPYQAKTITATMALSNTSIHSSLSRMAQFIVFFLTSPPTLFSLSLPSMKMVGPIQQLIWTQLFGCPLTRIQLQYKTQTEWTQLKPRAFVLHLWFPLILSLSHLEVRNYRINTRSS